MATNKLKNVSEKYLNSTERQAIAKLAKMHQPILKEMEKWKESREKLETLLIDQVDTMGKILKPYYEKSKKTLVEIARRKSLSIRTPNKKDFFKKEKLGKEIRISLINP